MERHLRFNSIRVSGGVFLLLGYSSTDEALLRPYTNLGVQDAIRGLQHYVNRHIANQVCIHIYSKIIKIHF